MAKLVEETILLRVPPDNPACLTRASLISKPWCRLLSDPTFGRCYCAFHRGGNLVVWDPTTGKQQRLPEPPVELGAYNVAVLCAVRGCDHLDCRGDPFFVVLVGYNQVLWLHLYSSEAGAWIASSHLGHIFYLANLPRDTILKYNLGRNCLSIINPPVEHDTHGGIALMQMEDDLLGIAGVLCSKLCLWSRNAEVVSGWVQFRVIELEPTLIPFRRSSSIKVASSAEGFGIIFVTTDVGVFTLELKSGQVSKVAKPSLVPYTVFPFMSFYTPGIVLVF
uniref:F-box domain-containing protein n=1 Tax=Setaria viridis TaxID=4556 RepID=A0A4U6VKV7_SETVI|nr:hypothetical protein SEVIR_2G024500v2 [Setaria viridis]